MGQLTEMPIIERREPEPQSISHWGMIALPMPPIMMVPAGFEFDERDLQQSGHIVWVKYQEH